MESMKLDRYNKKRDFDITAEPSGQLRPTKDGFSYVIQKHDATRLHYDFRLELDGVLLSWAVPKGTEPRSESTSASRCGRRTIPSTIATSKATSRTASTAVRPRDRVGSRLDGSRSAIRARG